MRLIDADKIKQSVTNEMLKSELNSPVYCTFVCVIADIESQPTAYDVDKVVEQLEENIKHAEREAKEYGEKGNIGVFDMLDARAKAYRNSIKIVKSGGIE